MDLVLCLHFQGVFCVVSEELITSLTGWKIKSHWDMRIFSMPTRKKSWPLVFPGYRNGKKKNGSGKISISTVHMDLHPHPRKLGFFLLFPCDIAFGKKKWGSHPDLNMWGSCTVPAISKADPLNNAFRKMYSYNKSQLGMLSAFCREVLLVSLESCPFLHTLSGTPSIPCSQIFPSPVL